MLWSSRLLALGDFATGQRTFGAVETVGSFGDVSRDRRYYFTIEVFSTSSHELVAVFDV